MKKIFILLLGLLTACSPIQSPVTSQYKLNMFSNKKIATTNTSLSILVAQPDAIAGYQTEDMLYTDKPFQLNSFAHSSWISSPANMLSPLIVQSLQSSHYFYAVTAGPNVDKTDYRLDTQVISLQQNFLVKPSALEFIVQVVITHISDNRVVASRTFKECVPCPSDTPYGGVVAANKATRLFTAALTHYVIAKVKQDQGTL